MVFGYMSKSHDILWVGGMGFLFSCVFFEPYSTMNWFTWFIGVYLLMLCLWLDHHEIQK